MKSEKTSGELYILGVCFIFLFISIYIVTNVFGLLKENLKKHTIIDGHKHVKLFINEEFKWVHSLDCHCKRSRKAK